MLCTSGLVSFKEGMQLIVNKLSAKQVKSFYLLWIKILLFPVFTSQHEVHQVHKSTSYFNLCHTAFPHFVSFPNNFVQSRIYMTFLTKSADLKFLQRPNQTLWNLRAQASQSGLYSVIVNHFDINIGTNWPMTKVVTWGFVLTDSSLPANPSSQTKW